MPSCLWTLLAALFVGEVELVQVVSREDPLFAGTGNGLAVGRDGFVYLFGGQGGDGYVLRVARDGSARSGGRTAYAITGVAANAEGVVATANAHFAKAVNVYDRGFRPLGKAGGFTGNDTVGWDGPGSIEVGASGDFYALDQHAGRVVRVDPAGRIVRTLPLRHADEPEPGKLWPYGFRVCEATERLYFIAGGQLRCVAFDGRTQWTRPARVLGDPWRGFQGGFDVDDAGTLYLTAGDATIERHDAAGQPLPAIQLRDDDLPPRPGTRRVSHLRVFRGDLVMRQPSDTELFRTYDAASGHRKHVATIAHERLRVTFPSEVWTAGQPVPLAIDFESHSEFRVPPTWHVGMRAFGTSAWSTRSWRDGRLNVPRSAAGLYQLRVGDGGLGGTASATADHFVETVVEVRVPESRGTVSIFTPLNRPHFGRGEEVPVSIVARAPPGVAPPASVTLKLLPATDENDDPYHALFPPPEGRPIGTVDVPLVAGQPAQTTITGRLTDALLPGRYWLTADMPGWTVAPQPLAIGDGFASPARASRPTFHIAQHGDYRLSYPSGTFWDQPDQLARHVATAQRLKTNLFVDRLGHGGSGALGSFGQIRRDDRLLARLEKDPAAVAPDKARFAGPVEDALAAYGAHGIESQAVLLSMDAGLPLGTGHDRRSPEQLAADVRRVTTAAREYPAFRGWSWAANWWLDKRGAAAAPPERRAEYEAALKRALDTGAWDRVLDEVAEPGYTCRATPSGICVRRSTKPPGRGSCSACSRPRTASPACCRRRRSARPTRSTCTTSRSRFSRRASPGTTSTSTSGPANRPGGTRNSGTTTEPAARSSPRACNC